MRYTIETRLKGMKSQYHVLKVFSGEKLPIVHTSKDLNYLYKLVKERYSK